MGSFGELLSEMIEEKNMTKTKFYEELGISKTYFFDVLKGRVVPPCSEMQFRIIQILQPSVEKRKQFFELAAEKRNEMPADIVWYYRSQNNRNKIRKSIDYSELLKSGGKNNAVE
ncbi:MAG: hypothetical protein K0R06_3076 [Clostridium sp.]|jgi:transcriptional regulator with XRE-family HTH domain|nr:hypothetical protein [Clostridium sp.]